MALGQEAAHADAFLVVFETHRDFVYNLARVLLRNTQDAEDVTQDVFVRVYKALPKYEPERAPIRHWLAQIAVNACRTHRRRNFWRSLTLSIGDVEDDPQEPVDLSLWGAPEEQALQAELYGAVRDVLGKLRMEHRTVLALHYYMDLSCLQIAQILGCPEGTVYSRLYYARRLVREQLEGQALDAPIGTKL